MLIVAALIGVVRAVYGLREWGWLFVAGIWLAMALVPVIEGAEQTVIQRVVPYEKQGRVFGFAKQYETAAPRVEPSTVEG